MFVGWVFVCVLYVVLTATKLIECKYVCISIPCQGEKKYDETSSKQMEKAFWGAFCSAQAAVWSFYFLLGWACNSEWNLFNSGYLKIFMGQNSDLKSDFFATRYKYGFIFVLVNWINFSKRINVLFAVWMV